MPKTCLITGVGPGTGTALVKRFREGDYRVAMLARSPENMASLLTAIRVVLPFNVTSAKPVNSNRSITTLQIP